MKLEEKGRYAPPLRLAGRAQKVALEIASWPGVQARSHWLLGDETVVDGADFYLGEEELGHLHLDGTAHIPLGEALTRAVLDARLAVRFPWLAGWVMTPTEDARRTEVAKFLFRLSYDRRQGSAIKELLAGVSGAPSLAP